MSHFALHEEVGPKVELNLQDSTSQLIGRVGVLRHPCDLDLLLFFARRRRALLTSDQLAAFLGYGVKDIAASLELFLDAGLLSRTPNRKHAARLYVFVPSDAEREWLPALLTLGSTREGRLEMMRALRRRRSTESDDAPRAGRESASGRAGPSLVPRRMDENRGSASG
jgi:hypothetical protein